MAECTGVAFMLIAALAVLAWSFTSPAWAATQNEIQKLLPSDGVEGDRFGGSVALHGDTAVIGGLGSHYNGWTAGSAYVFTRGAGGGWIEQQKLNPSDAATHNLGYWSVAVDGDTAVIGARGDDDNGFRSGSAYVFMRNAAGIWTEQQKLTASNAAERHSFGAAVAVDGDTAVIVATGAASAYVFERSAEGVWYETYVLTASGVGFGSSVAMQENTVLIGTFGGWDVWGDRQDAAYVFTRGAGGGWTEQQKLIVRDYGAYHGTPFNVSVAIDGNTAVIGSCFNHYSQIGIAYVFTRGAGGYFIEQQKLTTSDSEAGHEFGCSVAVDGDAALIGASSYDDATGSAYVFTRGAGGYFIEQQKLSASDGANYQWFGSSLAMDSQTAVIGAWGDDDNGFDSGSAYVFRVRRFDDVQPGYWAFSFIETLAASDITAGCGGDSYCPEDPVTRAQMAVFLERCMRGSGYSPPAATGNTFLDVGASDFAAAFIEQLYLDGITAGCGNNNYCSNDAVTRAQMAVFLLRAEHGAGYSPPPPVGLFADVDLSHWAVAWIEQLAAEGVTVGCGGGNYCPQNPATRAQMAVFLVRTFGL